MFFSNFYLFLLIFDHFYPFLLIFLSILQLFSLFSDISPKVFQIFMWISSEIWNWAKSNFWGKNRKKWGRGWIPHRKRYPWCESELSSSKFRILSFLSRNTHFEIEKFSIGRNWVKIRLLSFPRWTFFGRNGPNFRKKSTLGHLSHPILRNLSPKLG